MASRIERLEELRALVISYTEAEQRRKAAERRFLMSVRDRTVSRAERTMLEEQELLAVTTAQELVGIDS